ncbi:putative protein unc-13 [Helianthus anomalus]
MTAARRRQNPRRRPVHRRITPAVRYYTPKSSSPSHNSGRELACHVGAVLVLSRGFLATWKLCQTTKDPTYAKILSSTLTSILGWAEQRLLAYHDTFDNVNINSMQSIVSLGVSAAKIMVEDIYNEYRRRRKNDTDVARSRIDTYIRSSLRTAFVQARFYLLLYF